MRNTADELVAPGQVVDLGSAREVLAGGRAVVTAGVATSVLIIQTRRGVFAMQNQCPHRGMPLATASTRRGRIKCAFHGREYDMTSGACRAHTQPTGRPLRTYHVWIEHDHLFLALPSEAD
jgi:nitrite reductase/ring-hydroxylating ferredoxin subunit